MPADEWLERTRQTLADYLPRRLERGNATPAAILVLIYDRDGEAHIVFTERTHQVEHHKGQISFPGGAKDPQDRDFLDTALRETHEEMGIKPADVTVLGQLDDVTTRSGFKVQVYVGTIDYHYDFKPSDIEIAEVLEVPLSVLRDPASLRVDTRWEEGREVNGYSYAYNGHLIYGATARILQQFLGVLEDGLAV